jgi:hypothetical protein
MAARPKKRNTKAPVSSVISASVWTQGRSQDTTETTSPRIVARRRGFTAAMAVIVMS